MLYQTLTIFRVLGVSPGELRKTMLILEAAGFDVILIETVGVGQSEVTVSEMVDFSSSVITRVGGLSSRYKERSSGVSRPDCSQ